MRKIKELLHLPLPASASAALDLELLLRQALSKNRTFVLTNPDYVLTAPEYEAFMAFYQRRQQSEPISYITGTREFYGYNFAVSSAVLIPRPETEHLVELALAQIIGSGAGELSVLELGTGSGCISIAIALELAAKSPEMQVSQTAVDLSLSALQVAKTNAKTHAVSEQIAFFQSDWFSACAGQSYDFILSNPPYVDPDLKLQKELDYEPQEALYAAERGTADIRTILEAARTHLRPEGSLIIECGAEQQPELSSYINQNFPAAVCQFYADLAGLIRGFSLKY